MEGVRDGCKSESIAGMFFIGEFKDREKFRYVIRDMVIDIISGFILTNRIKFTSTLTLQLFCVFFHYPDMECKGVILKMYSKYTFNLRNSLIR